VIEKVSELHPPAPHEEFEEVDTSLFNTAKRSTILGYKLGSLFLSRTIGLPELPFARNPDAKAGPKRHVELNPDKSVSVETVDGSEHEVDIYGLGHLENPSQTLSPLVMIMPLSLPHNKGFQAPIIDDVQKHAKEQGRAVIVVSSEGFGDKALPLRETIKLSFDQMADNIHEVLDMTEQRLYVQIPEIITAGGSRGGTLSLLVGSSDTQERRLQQGRNIRRVKGVIATAPAGLRPLDSLRKKAKVAKQFGINEPFHIVRKASSLEPEDLFDYGHTLIESLPRFGALPAIGKTALLFMNDTPLEDVGRKLDEDTAVWILTMQNDGITTPKYWKQEFGHLPFTNIITLPGHHVSIDSIGKVAGNIKLHLDQDAENAMLMRLSQG